jgi:hypothetical protein
MDALSPEVQARHIRMNELLDNLQRTDHKVLPDYDRPDPAIVVLRQQWREEWRALSSLDDV